MIKEFFFRSIKESVHSNGSFILNETYLNDSRSCFQKAYHKILFIVKEIFSGIFIIYNRIKGMIFKRKEYINPSITNYPWKKDNKGLCLLIHGLNAAPSDWNRHIKEMKKKSSDYEILAPYISKGGNCSLEEAAKPILKFVQSYINKYPNNPIFAF